MDKFYELLKKNEQEISDKFSYYTKRFRGISYEELLRRYSGEIELGIFPRIVEKKYPVIGKLKISVLLILTGHDYKGIKAASACYIEDKTCNSRIWILSKLVDKESNTEKSYFICMTKHYISRFEERNPIYKLYAENLKEAAAIDLGLALESKMALLTNLELIKGMSDYEKQREEAISLVTLMKKVEPGISRYLSLEKSTGIMRTMSGYGIYKAEGTKITLITWLSEKMLNNNQKRIFTILAPDKSLS